MATQGVLIDITKPEKYMTRDGRNVFKFYRNINKDYPIIAIICGVEYGTYLANVYPLNGKFFNDGEEIDMDLILRPELQQQAAQNNILANQEVREIAQSEKFEDATPDTAFLNLTPYNNLSDIRLKRFEYKMVNGTSSNLPFILAIREDGRLFVSNDLTKHPVTPMTWHELPEIPQD